MTSTQKIEKLNKLSEQLRLSVRDISELFKENNTLSHIVWKINKQISLLHQEVCRTLEKEVTDEEFKNIVKHLEQSLGE